MKILESTSIGQWSLKNRMVMAPMTRSRADNDGIINDSAQIYYAQRASAGLIISEAINISEQGIGMPNTPGIYTRRQVEAWKRVTDAVHQSAGIIVAQLNHSGRVAHSLNRAGKIPVAPSAVAIKTQTAFTRQGQKEYEIPQALTRSEIKEIVRDYAVAAAHALEAGFDGIELHGALGYLPNQFLMESSNLRDDEYGGSVTNRARFMIQVLEAVTEVTGAFRTGIKLSPSMVVNNMFDSDPVGVYRSLINQLNELPLAYIHLMQALYPLEQMPQYPRNPLLTFGNLCKPPVITNGGYDRQTAERVLQTGQAALVSFGSLFLANPDLPKRFELNTEINKPDPKTMYVGGDATGYTDYPFLPGDV